MTVNDFVDALFNQLTGSPPEEYPALVRIAINTAVEEAYESCKKIALEEDCTDIGCDIAQAILKRKREVCR